MPRKKLNLKSNFFLILCYLEQKGGKAKLSEIENYFGISREEVLSLVKEFDLCEIAPCVILSVSYDRAQDTIQLEYPQELEMPAFLTAKEAIAFMFALTAFKEYLGDAEGGYNLIIKKFEKSFPEILKEAAEEELKIMGAVFPNSEVRKTVVQLLDAINQKRTVELSYYPFTKGTPERYRLNPIHVGYYFKNFYLWALDTEDGEVKTFIVDNIYDLEIKNRRFELSESTKQRFKNKLEEFKSKKYEQFVELRARGFSARYIEEMFTGYEKYYDEAGDLIVKVPLISLEWLVTRWLLPYGGEVVIDKPEDIARQAAEKIRKMLEVYQKV